VYTRNDVSILSFSRNARETGNLGELVNIIMKFIWWITLIFPLSTNHMDINLAQ